MRIHAYLWRSVRSPVEAQNVRIRVFSIICMRAKEAGRQYSKRILPPFVIPFCQIIRDGVFAYLRRHPDGSVLFAVGLELLGAWDRRTVRRHLGRAVQLIGGACLQVAQLLSGLLAYASLPQPPLGQPPLEKLEEFAREADRVRRRAGGGTAPQMPAVVYVHLVDVFERARRPLSIPLTCALRMLVVPDTS
jgi:hypothetical protein